MPISMTSVPLSTLQMIFFLFMTLLFNVTVSLDETVVLSMTVSATMAP